MVTPQLMALCLRIFFTRILDVSLGTVRTLFTVKGKTAIASLVGFVEVMVWFLVVRTAFNSDEAGLLLAVFYAGGYAVGTYVGGKIASRVIKGTVTMQIVTSERDDSVVNAIRDAGFGVSVVNVNASQYGGEKYMLFAEIAAARLGECKSLVYSLDPHAFITVQESKYVYNGFIK